MMNRIPVIAVYDVGKTNKKLLLFDTQYKPVHESSAQLPETTDEEGFPCENVQLLTEWVRESFARAKSDRRYDIRAVNFSGYGASFILLDHHGKVIAPLYNYLKPYPKELLELFYHTYGGREQVCRQTASPALGSLNSGLQLYRLKHEKPDLFARTRVALHLPQYLSYILSENCVSEITSIGCHTHLWDFEKHRYHDWVTREGIEKKLAPLQACGSLAGITRDGVPTGVGLHDSSAALIPYLRSFTEPFVLLSTGTWSISLNPFNSTPLTDQELQADCLCYLTYEEKQVKASRLFAGHIHEQNVNALSVHFGMPADYYKHVRYSPDIIRSLLRENNSPASAGTEGREIELSTSRDLQEFQSYEEAYHRLILMLVTEQINSTNLVLNGSQTNRLFVDGGFSRNNIYMQVLTDRYPSMEISAANVAQASALGAALAMHSHWNTDALPESIVETTRYYPGNENISIG